MSVSSRVLNYLGALSFGLYAFQCPADLLRLLGVDSIYLLLGLIVGLSFLEDIIKRLVKRKKQLDLCAQSKLHIKS